MEIVGTIVGSVLGSVFQVLLEKLASLLLEYAHRKVAPPFSGVNTELLNEWKEMLVTINAVLDDAEDKQLSGGHLVKKWLDDVRDLAYDMEDLLDDLAIQATEVKPAAKSSASRGWVNWKCSCFGRDESSGSNPNPLLLMPETRVQEINGRLKEIIKKKDPLNLIATINRSNNTEKRLPSTCLPEKFFGRQREEADILKLLIGEDKSSDATLSIVPIVGMGGIGKTALARQLYNDANVSSCFEIRAWVCVSDDFDVIVITKAILQSITKLRCEDKDLNWLQVELKGILSGKKFLVVLDDVWNEYHDKWIALLKPFEVGAKGSKIIITARNRSAIFEKGSSPYRLEELPLDYCTSILAFHALDETNFEGHQDLEIIGKKIAEKCKGLPLAATMLGGLLRGKRNPDEWEAILNSKIWDLPKGKKDEILPVLKLSYVHLPSYLKRCFVYCAVYPKDYEIERDELVLLWIAEGFLDGQEVEDILRLGRDHFDQLVSRSFLQHSRVDASKFSMHDLLNDLANSIAGGTCFSSGESQVVRNENVASLEKARYASFISSGCVTSKFMRAYHRMKALRSLMLLVVGPYKGISISNKVLHDLLTKLKYLRVFSLCRCDIVEVPNCIGELKHLRHLNFSYTNIKTLPESISGLCKLQALILRGCRELSALPPSITKLASLQFLDIRDTNSLKEMPLGMSNLKNLIVLSKFVVGSEKGSRLEELQNLPHLQGELFISELQKVEEVRDAVDANLFGKQGLSNLVLCWDADFRNTWNGKRESQVLHYLRPHINLKSLTISHYGGAIIPSWLEGSSYSKLVSLCLRGCPNVTSLPSLGQLPLLRELSLEGLHAIRMIDSEFYGSKSPFTSLTTLKFEEMLAWKDWSPYARGQEEEVSFSCLQHLVVRRCPSLVGTLPCQLDQLTKLEILSCPHLNISTSVVRLPSLYELYLEDCSKEILKSLVILTSLTILRIKNITELVCFDPGFMGYLVKLKGLHIVGCDKLTYLWQDGNEMLNLTCLQHIIMQSCPRFTSFLAGEGEMELPRNLQMMELIDCESLEKLPCKMHTLKVLKIQDCPKIMGVNIPRDGPSTSSNNPMYQLEVLDIGQCEFLTSFPFAKGRFAALKALQIWECKGVESLEEINTAESLEILKIEECENLESLPRCLHTLSHITFLLIRKCPALEIEEFPPLPITLSSFCLHDCPKIKALPNQWHHLTSLRNICIWNCPNIECLPKGGFPPNLRILDIRGCENVKQPVREWGLPFLTSLDSLTIDGGGEGEKVWFPSKDEDAWSLLFPSSLTHLDLRNMRKVERLSSGLCNHLSSLQLLVIVNCPKLRYLPEDGLPPSLQRLWINDCSNLKEGCSKLTGYYWPLIQHIPLVEIDKVRIR